MLSVVYQIYFDILENGAKTKNPQTPINGDFEQSTTGDTTPEGWNIPTVTTGYDAQVRPSENPTVTTRTANAAQSRTVNGTPFNGLYSFLIGDRSDTSNAGVGNGGSSISKTIKVPTNNPGNLVFKYRIQGWDSADYTSGNYDYLRVQIIGTTTATLVGPAARNYNVYPFAPNYGDTQATNSSSGYSQYNGWDFGTGSTRRTQDGNPAMTVAKGSEPWFTVTYSLAAFAGKTISLNFSTIQKQLFKTWVHIDDVEWSVITGTLGTPYKVNFSVDAANFDCLETGTNTPYNSSSRNPLYTKIANTNFSFDIVALNTSNNIETNFVVGSSNSKNVTVEIFDASTVKSCSTYTSPIATTTATFNDSSAGRVTIPNLISTKAYSKLICRVKDSNPSTPIYGCSTDTFSIRPQSISDVTSNANADLSGLSKTASPTIVAGENFNITVSTNTIGYNGTPKINSSLIEWPNAPTYGVPQATNNGAGVISGLFSNPASSTTGNNASGVFNYSEAGYFRFKMQGVFDDDFVAISMDLTNNDCIVGSFSNVLVGGKYGCNFGTTSPSNYMGRFIPNGFNVASTALINRSNLMCSSVPNFTYLGESFDISFALTPVNKNGQKILNYDREKLDTSSVAGLNISASNGLTSRISATNYASLWNSVGVFNASVKLNISRNLTPDGPFNNINISINPKDLDNVSVLSNLLDVDTNEDSVLDAKKIGTTNFYFGRMKINNATGSELLKLAIPIEVQYFNGAGFITNTNDSCTSLSASNFSANGFTQNLSSVEVSFSYPTQFINGKQTIIMNKPSGGDGIYNGSFNLSYNLTSDNKTFLQGKWTNSTYTENPNAKIVLSRQASKSRLFFSKDAY